ncbi:hypothetical protein OSB04_014645 [Centaurea solstitialis]|uniref:SHSP domain-containing protein n=1 Tax=Centaurea solstitialis TaxID=347529 RepID=A0AA38T9F9_9ASTR|nr:hypothetical protein OSB04_014645 [Centaurea solstitialis]
MDISFMGFDTPFFRNLHHILDDDENTNNKKSSTASGPTRAYVRDARAMAATPADVKEYPNSYVFIVDMPGLKSGDIKVQVEDENVLVISGERKREEGEEKEGVKYVRMERRIGKFMRKFVLPENANTEKISAICQDGVLTVTVEKLPPPEPKKPKLIQLKHNHNNSTRKMDISFMGFDTPFFRNLHHILEATDDENNNNKKSSTASGPTRAYVRDARAMAATPADVKEYPNSYVFIVDMPGLKSGDIKVQVEEENVLVISGERKREHEQEEKEGVKYVRMERRIGKFMRKFVLPENANTEKISAICQDGVLTVTVEKLPPPEPKKPKLIQVQVA